jgi:hypothetical protein
MELHDAEHEDVTSDPEDREEGLFDGEDDEENLMDDGEGDVASSDSELQVQDPSQEMGESQAGGKI